MELCSQTLVIFKHMVLDLLRKNKSLSEVEKLWAQLNESTTSLQSALDVNNSISSKNKELEAELAMARVNLNSCRNNVSRL